MTVQNATIEVKAICPICFRRYVGPAGYAGYVFVDPSNPDVWELLWHDQKLGEKVAAETARWSTPPRFTPPNITRPGTRTAAGRKDRKLRLLCPSGHRLNPTVSAISREVRAALRVGRGYFQIPEQGSIE